MIQPRLTPGEARVFRFLVDYRSVFGFSPTCTLLAHEFSVKKPTLFEHLQGLVKKGWLTPGEHNYSSGWIPTVEARAIGLLPRLLEFVWESAESGEPEAKRLQHLIERGGDLPPPAE